MTNLQLIGSARDAPKRADCALGESAIWSAHGDEDNVVPFAPDHDTLTSLMACPPAPAPRRHLHGRRERGHDIWDRFTT